MITRKWLVETENPHTVQVDHWSTWSGRIHIYVDDELIHERRSKLFDFGMEHRFKVDGLPYIIRILHRIAHYEYELWVDGKLQ